MDAYSQMDLWRIGVSPIDGDTRKKDEPLMAWFPTSDTDTTPVRRSLESVLSQAGAANRSHAVTAILSQKN